jgi:hypothetical protein
LSGLPSDGDPELSPGAEQAIENAIETFLSDPEIKSAIAAKINEVNAPWQSTGANLVAILVPMSFFGVIGLMAWLFYRRGQTRMQTRTEFHQQVLSKFTSGQEFAAFLNSPGSQQLLEGMWGERVDLKARLLKHVRLGAVFGVVGLGFLGLTFFENSGWGFLAVVCLGIGIGFLISARVSYRLAEKMGLLQKQDTGDSANSAGPQP